MPIGGSAARRYAEALFDLATQERAVPAYRSSLERLGAAFGPATVRALRDPRVSFERRRAALDAASKDEPKAIRAVLDLLLQRDRVGLVPAIATAYADIDDAHQGIVKARITTPIELAAGDRDRFVRRLEHASGKTIRASFAVDASLIGGAKVQLGDHLIDTSLRTQLNALARDLAG